jgi:hypothetical protein
MNTLEVHPEIIVRELPQQPAFSTCFECQRSFRAKCEDQLSLELCDHCFDLFRHLREPILSVHVKVRPRQAAAH